MSPATATPTSCCDDAGSGDGRDSDARITGRSRFTWRSEARQCAEEVERGRISASPPSYSNYTTPSSNHAPQSSHVSSPPQVTTAPGNAAAYQNPYHLRTSILPVQLIQQLQLLLRLVHPPLPPPTYHLTTPAIVHCPPTLVLRRNTLPKTTASRSTTRNHLSARKKTLCLFDQSLMDRPRTPYMVMDLLVDAPTNYLSQMRGGRRRSLGSTEVEAERLLVQCHDQQYIRFIWPNAVPSIAN